MMNKPARNVLLLLSVLFTGCEYTKEGESTIVEPPPVLCVLPPPILAATVTPQDCIANGCPASYSVPSSRLEVSTISWTFTGGSPGTSSTPSGAVTYRPVPTVFPAQFGWQLEACSCPKATDPTRASCSTVSGIVIFETP